jgi:ParB-like chromosome segregation protein Spo0J
MIKEKSLRVSGVNTNRLFIDYVPTLSIEPNEYNPNTHGNRSFDLLLRSICLFGFTQPNIVDKKTKKIIDGEHRWRCACVLDLPEVPVCFISLSPEKMRLATIMHNEARGKHSDVLIRDIEIELQKSGVNLDDELLKDRRV